MKTRSTIKGLMLALVGIAMLAACKPTTEGEVGEPFDKIEGMSGTWELSRFIQKDLNNPIKEERDLSQFYIKDNITPLRLTFDAADRTYSVAIETGRNYFGEGGTWAFDNDDYPSFIFLTTTIDGVETELEFELGSMVRSFDNTLLIELGRGCNLGTADEIPTVIYRFEFTRITE